MKAPSSRHLSHDFPAYKGLTLRELLIITTTTTLSGCGVGMFLGACVGFPIAFGLLGFFIGFIVAVTLLPNFLARLKADKPYGYVSKILTQRLSDRGIIRSPYLTHVGFWAKSRFVRGSDV